MCIEEFINIHYYIQKFILINYETENWLTDSYNLDWWSISYMRVWLHGKYGDTRSHVGARHPQGLVLLYVHSCLDLSAHVRNVHSGRDYSCNSINIYNYISDQHLHMYKRWGLVAPSENNPYFYFPFACYTQRGTSG